jgi:hypothetical protein
MAIATQYWPLGGGLDLVSPAVSLPPGGAILAQNFECALNGGYRRMDGYTIYDGRTTGVPLGVSGSGPIRGVWEYGGDVYAFRDNTAGTACVMHKATTSGWTVVTTPTLAVGGSYDFVNYNFGGHSGTQKMYGSDGVNKAFQFDGTTFTQITTGMSSDTPTYVGVHKNHLFLSFSGGSVQHSGIGDPLTWTLATGAGEIGLGTEVTGLRSMQGNSLVITGSDRINILYGTSSADWDLKSFSMTTGAVAKTQAHIETGLYFFNGDDLTSLAATQSFGDFETANIGALIKPYLESRKGLIVGASVNKDKNQYRLFFSDKTVLVGTIVNGAVVGYTNWLLSDTPSYIGEGYFGCTDGSVMRVDTGTSFNGGEIQSFLRLAFTPLGTPQRKKRYRKAILEVESSGQVTLNYLADYDYGTGGSSSSAQVSIAGGAIAGGGGGGFWDVATWDDFVWSSAVVASPEAYLNGTGRNISLLIVHTSATEPAFTLQGVQLNYTIRGFNR